MQIIGGVMDKQEKIVCAAVKITYKDGVGDYAADVICDATHKLIRSGQSYKRQHFVHVSTAKDIDGFRTNYGRFVDPVEAQKIAIACGQYEDPHSQIAKLERTIEIAWDSVRSAKTGMMISALKADITRYEDRLEKLKSGYLGNKFRVEDLRYVKP